MDFVQVCFKYHELNPVKRKEDPLKQGENRKENNMRVLCARDCVRRFPYSTSHNPENSDSVSESLPLSPFYRKENEEQRVKHSGCAARI